MYIIVVIHLILLGFLMGCQKAGQSFLTCVWPCHRLAFVGGRRIGTQKKRVEQEFPWFVWLVILLNWLWSWHSCLMSMQERTSSNITTTKHLRQSNLIIWYETKGFSISANLIPSTLSPWSQFTDASNTKSPYVALLLSHRKTGMMGEGWTFKATCAVAVTRCWTVQELLFAGDAEIMKSKTETWWRGRSCFEPSSA